MLPARPGRLEAMLDVLVQVGGTAELDELAGLLMPATESPDMLDDTINAARLLGLVQPAGSDANVAIVSGCSGLRGARLAQHIAPTILSARTSDDPNYRFCRFYSWLLARFDLRLPSMAADQLAQHFDEELGLTDRSDTMSAEKARLSCEWASFLGLGWWDRTGAFGFQPIPLALIGGSLDRLFAKADSLTAEQFMVRLSKLFPLLDRGDLFRSLPNTDRFATELTPGLSAALRGLDSSGQIKLVVERDAPTQVSLSSHGDASVRSFVAVRRVV